MQDPFFLPSYAERCRELREKRGWTQQQLAAEIGCSVQYVKFIETERRTNPGRMFLAALEKLEK